MAEPVLRLGRRGSGTSGPDTVSGPAAPAAGPADRRPVSGRDPPVDYTTERDRRVHRYLGAQVDPEDLDFDHPLRHAAIYPETVDLTALLAGGVWRKQALSCWPAARQAFHDEFTRRVTAHHRQPDSNTWCANT